MDRRRLRRVAISCYNQSEAAGALLHSVAGCVEVDRRELDRPYIAAIATGCIWNTGIVNWAWLAALIGRDATCSVPSVDSRAARKQGAGESRAAIVLQGSESWIDRRSGRADLITGH